MTGDDQHLNGDQSNNGNTHHGDDDGRMTFKIPNMGGQVIWLFCFVFSFSFLSLCC
jgi:hypothetical protein